MFACPFFLQGGKKLLIYLAAPQSRTLLPAYLARVVPGYRPIKPGSVRVIPSDKNFDLILIESGKWPKMTVFFKYRTRPRPRCCSTPMTYRNRPEVAEGILTWWRTSFWRQRSPAIGAWRSATVAWNPSTPWAQRQRSASRTIFGSWSGERASDLDPSGWVHTSCSGGIPRGSGCYRTAETVLKQQMKTTRNK